MDGARRLNLRQVCRQLPPPPVRAIPGPMETRFPGIMAIGVLPPSARPGRTRKVAKTGRSGLRSRLLYIVLESDGIGEALLLPS